MLLGERTPHESQTALLSMRPWVVLDSVRPLFWCKAHRRAHGAQLTQGSGGSRGPRKSSARTTTRWWAACAACRCRCRARTTRRRRRPSAACSGRLRATSAGAARGAGGGCEGAVAGPSAGFLLSHKTVGVHAGASSAVCAARARCLCAVGVGLLVWVDARVARCAAHVCMPHNFGCASQWALAHRCRPACACRAQAEDAAGARERPTCALTMMIRARDDDVCP